VKLYRYDKFEKLNQALGSFKKNDISVIKVQPLLVDNEIIYFVLTDSKYKPNPSKKTPKPIKVSKSPKAIIKKKKSIEKKKKKPKK